MKLENISMIGIWICGVDDVPWIFQNQNMDTSLDLKASVKRVSMGALFEFLSIVVCFFSVAVRACILFFFLLSLPFFISV